MVARRNGIEGLSPLARYLTTDADAAQTASKITMAKGEGIMAFKGGEQMSAILTALTIGKENE